MKPVYINGTSAITGQHTFKKSALSDMVVTNAVNRFRAVEPDYSAYLNPVLARRMGRVIKMGIASSMEALKDAGIESPGATITGTALGNLGDTEKFLTSVIRDDEQFLTPTNFIQSLQNTVSAQIALQLKCMEHNFTFVHKGFSFESALLDALMLINDDESDHVLVGGLDEMTDHNHHIYSRLGIWKQTNIPSENLYQYHSNGTIAGEGSVFFVLGRDPGSNCYASLVGLQMIYAPESASDIFRSLNELMIRSGWSDKDPVLMIWGDNGDVNHDLMLKEVRSHFTYPVTNGFFKHLTGEYQTSSAAAMWLGATILKSGVIPGSLLLNTPSGEQRAEKVAIINSYGNNYTIILMSSK